MNTTPSTIRTPSRCLFALGNVVATPGALDLLDRAATNAAELLQRHQSGDWGNVPPDDAEENLRAIQYGGRLLPSYTLNGNEKLWIITEADRSVTTLLLPQEY